MPLTDAECRLYAERQIARQLTPEDIEACQGFDSEDLRRIASHLPLQLAPFVIPDAAGRPLLVRNKAHALMARSRELAERLEALALDVEHARGLFYDRRPEPGAHAGLGSAEHKTAALAYPVSDAMTEHWRQEAAAVLRSLAETARNQRFDLGDDSIEALGVVRSYGAGTAIFAEGV